MDTKNLHYCSVSLSIFFDKSMWVFLKAYLLLLKFRFLCLFFNFMHNHEAVFNEMTISHPSVVGSFFSHGLQKPFSSLVRAKFLSYLQALESLV